METIIIICLLVIIVLLFQDKIVITKKTAQKSKPEKNDLNPSHIMGESKREKRFKRPDETIEYPDNTLEDNNSNFEPQNIIFSTTILQKVSDDVFEEKFNPEEEEEEWEKYRESGGENGFATGVTFEELSTVEKLFQQDLLEDSLQQKGVGILQKIEGTELLSLLEKSLGESSGKIAQLLEKEFSGFKTNPGPSFTEKKIIENFDIEEFL